MEQSNFDELNDHESYIEIALHHPDHTQYFTDDDDMELRISFSSNTFQLPSVHSCDSSSSPTFSFSSSPAEKIQFPAVNFTVNALDADPENEVRSVSNSHLELLRPASKSWGRNMMMKLCIRFQDWRLIKTLVASLVKLSHSNSAAGYKQNKSQRNGQKPWRLVETNLDSIRGVFGRNKKIITTTKCSPSSTASSPLHHHDNSIQPAIAHCKRSFDPSYITIIN